MRKEGTKRAEEEMGDGINNVCKESKKERKREERGSSGESRTVGGRQKGRRVAVICVSALGVRSMRL